MLRPVFGLVLAGGESRRMGHDKALLDRNGQSQLAFVVDLLGQSVQQVFVSTRAGQANDVERQQFKQIVDRYENVGPIAGILSALEEHPDVDWLVTACDLPNITKATIEHLLESRNGDGDDDQPFTAYTSTYDGLPEPLCAVYHAGCKSIVQKFLDDGIVCPRKMLIRSDTRLLQQIEPGSLDNINTPDDLESSVLQASQ